MKINTDDYRVREGQHVNLNDWPTGVEAYYKDKANYKKMLRKQIRELSDLQGKLYSHDRYALLLIFQAMDAAGKDGAIKHVMSGINPQGCQVSSFKQPNPEELDHDFLWRTTRKLPERGRIGIFNRSYYEEVLIVRVHPEILNKAQIPDEHYKSEGFWEGRFSSIRDYESHLHRTGTRIIKFFLHVSREEQGRRFLSRIDEPEKNWKFSRADLKERGFWDEYQEAYGTCMKRTSTNDCPWFVVPANDKRNARLIISAILLNTLRSLPIAYPKTSDERRKELLGIRETLVAELGDQLNG